MLAAALGLLGVLAALALIGSEMPLSLSLPLALLAAGEGVRLARREYVRPKRLLAICGDGTSSLDGQKITGLSVEWRGPMAFMRFVDGAGRPSRLAWWPDILPARSRRELKLAAPVKAAALPPPSMAP